MPSAATAPTATAAQTSAAGSRMLGYYLGVGGVKVDCLFDTANFLTKSAGGKFTANAALGVGSAADPVALFHVRGGGLGAAQVRIESTSTWPNVALYNNSADPLDRNWAIMASYSAYGDLAFRRSNAAGGDPLTAGTTVLRFLSNAQVIPGVDNSQSIGSASFRWSVVYAGTGTINTSDAREKTWRGAPTFAEMAASRRIAAELGFYQWNDAITEKGPDGARLHFGVRAQAVWAIMADEGLIDPIAEGVRPDSRYAFLCYDEGPAIETVDEVRDEEGNVVAPAVPAQPGGNRFGVRPDQLALFLIAAQEARLAALEAAS